jgi:hypothetical protein
MNPPPSRAIPRAIAITLVIATLTGAAYLLFFQGPMNVITHSKNQSEQLGRTIYQGIDDILHVRPKVTVNGTTITQASADIAQLATVEKNFEHTHSFESTWLGSTKRHSIKGRFTAKAGFDLKDALQVDISSDQRDIQLTLPAARLLSLEQNHVEILQDENGVWNKISAQERQDAINALMQGARDAIIQTEILHDAQKSLEKQLTDIIRAQAPQDSQITIKPLNPRSEVER